MILMRPNLERSLKNQVKLDCNCSSASLMYSINPFWNVCLLSPFQKGPFCFKSSDNTNKLIWHFRCINFNLGLVASFKCRLIVLLIKIIVQLAVRVYSKYFYQWVAPPGHEKGSSTKEILCHSEPWTRVPGRVNFRPIVYWVSII